MQVNSMQDYVTLRKRQIIARTLYSTPPPQQLKSNSVYLSAVANSATTRQRFVLPTVSAWGSVPGTATYSSLCAGCEASSGAPGTFRVVNTKNTHLTRQLPLSIHNGIIG